MDDTGNELCVSSTHTYFPGGRILCHQKLQCSLKILVGPLRLAVALRMKTRGQTDTRPQYKTPSKIWKQIGVLCRRPRPSGGHECKERDQRL